MITNIVFDMGKVLVEYEADRVCRHFTDNEEEIRRITSAVFVSPEWVMLDMGLIPEAEAIEKITARLDTERDRELATLCFEHWHEYNMYPKEGMEEVVMKLKDRGYGLYICSNASIRLTDCYKRVIPAIDCFDGVLFSAQVKCMKPQREMYHHLFERFGLKPEECFFVDDLEMNIEGAWECGMRGFCFQDGDTERLFKKLTTLNRMSGSTNS